jgi:threonine dehydratase
MKAAFEAGETVTLPKIDTIADGLAPVRAGALTYRHLRALADEIVTVPDEAIREATRFLATRAKLVVEFSGAATLAALLSGAVDVSGRRVAVVVSGGNMDPSILRTIL